MKQGKLPKKNSRLRLALISTLVLLLFILMISSRAGQAFLVVVLFAVANVFFTLYKRYFYFPLELELLSLGIVLVSKAYGIVPGLILALVGGLAYTIICTSFNPFSIPMLMGYSLMALIAAYAPISNIVLLGILANLIHNVFTFLIYQFVFRYDPAKNLMYSGSNLVFNLFLFFNVAPLLYGIIS